MTSAEGVGGGEVPVSSDGDDQMRAKIKTQTKSIGLPTKCKEIPGAEINPLKNPMPKFEALKISRKHEII